MKIVVTARELLDLGVWDRACEMLGLNIYAVNEGRMSEDEEITLTEDQARTLGVPPPLLRASNDCGVVVSAESPAAFTASGIEPESRYCRCTGYFHGWTIRFVTGPLTDEYRFVENSAGCEGGLIRLSMSHAFSASPRPGDTFVLR